MVRVPLYDGSTVQYVYEPMYWVPQKLPHKDKVVYLNLDFFSMLITGLRGGDTVINTGPDPHSDLYFKVKFK